MMFKKLAANLKFFAHELSATLKKAATTEKVTQDPIEAVALEERIMMSATPMVEAPPPEVEVDSPESGLAEEANTAAATDSQTTVGVVFIDQAVENYQELIDGLSPEFY